MPQYSKIMIFIFFLIFLSHCHALWVSTNYVWQEHVSSVTHLSRIHCLVTAMWQENNLTVTHNALIHNKYDSVIGKTLKLFLHKRGNTSTNRTFISLLFWCKAVATPIQVQFKSNSASIRNWKYIGLAIDVCWVTGNAAKSHICREAATTLLNCL